jgi:hypothetical protein
MINDGHFGQLKINIFLEGFRIWIGRVTFHNVPSFFRKIRQIPIEKIFIVPVRQNVSIRWELNFCDENTCKGIGFIKKINKVQKVISAVF